MAKLLTIYGARLSKNKNYLNLSLIEGEGDEKQFYNACVKLVNTKIQGEFAYIKVKMLKESKHVADKKELSDEELPF